MHKRIHLIPFVGLLLLMLAVAACGPTAVSDPPESDTEENVEESGGEVSQGMPLPPDPGFPEGPHTAVTGPDANIACDGGASVGGGPSVNFTVNNPTDVTFTAYWIDFDGVEQPGQDILPGEGFASESGVLQAWCFREKDTGNYAQGLILGDSEIVYNLSVSGSGSLGVSTGQGALTGQAAVSACDGGASVAGGATVELIVNNPTDVTFTAYWINFDGVEQPSQDVLPGDGFQIETGVQQAWCFREKDTGSYAQGVILGDSAFEYDLSLDVVAFGSTEGGQDPNRICPDLVTLNEGDEIIMTVNNPTDTTFIVYWIGYDGTAQQWDEIEPGMVKILSTYANQSWCFNEKDTGAYEQGVTLTEDTRVDLTTE